MLIDTHAQLVPYQATPLRLLDEMAGAKVRRAVLVQNQKNRNSEQYLLKTLRRYADHFAGVVWIDPRQRGATGKLRDLAKREGVAGVQLLPGLEPRQTWLNSPQTAPFWEAVRELGLPVCLLIRSHQYNQLSDIVTDYPEIRIVLDHLGQGPETRKVVPHYLPVMLEYARYPQVYVKISKLSELSRKPHPHEDLWPSLQEICKRFGARRLMWGSDYPTIQRRCGYRLEARLLDQLPFLNADDRHWIKYATAQGLWFQRSG